MRKLIVSLAVVLIGVLTLLWIENATKPRPIINYARYPKAFCVPKIAHIKFVFWHEEGERATATELTDLFLIDEEKKELVKNILGKIPKIDFSIEKSDNYLSLIPSYDRQMIIGIERYNGNKIHAQKGDLRVFGDLYPGEAVDRSIRISFQTGSRVSHNYSSQAEVSLSNGIEENAEFKLFVRSINDLINGRCDRIASSSIRGPSENWKFFPPNEHFNDRNEWWYSWR